MRGDIELHSHREHASSGVLTNFVQDLLDDYGNGGSDRSTAFGTVLGISCLPETPQSELDRFP